MSQRIRARSVATMFVVALAVGGVPNVGHALEIVLDYEYDTFVYENPIARAALEAAAADVSAAITSQLNPIPTDIFDGISGNMQLSFNWEFLFTNPESGNWEVDSLAWANADEVTLFVGGRSLAGNTLGAGGPAVIGLAPDWPTILNPTPSDLAGALASAESQSESAYLRGGAGPVVGNRLGSVTVGPVEADYEVDFGVAVGSLWFDVDPTNAWHFDHTTATVPAGKNDFYTVALHEILHTLGIGSSATWTSMVSGSNWSGSEVAALAGGGGVINGDEAHIASGVQSTRISDGVSQTALMTDSITLGTRKKLTALDLAFLRDIGWETIDPVAAGSDGDYNGNGIVDAADYTVWLDSLGGSVAAGSGADGNSNGIIDQADYQFWKNRFGDVTGTATGTLVPESSTIVLMFLGLAAFSARPRTGCFSD